MEQRNTHKIVLMQSQINTIASQLNATAVNTVQHRRTEQKNFITTCFSYTSLTWCILHAHQLVKGVQEKLIVPLKSIASGV